MKGIPDIQVNRSDAFFVDVIHSSATNWDPNKSMLKMELGIVANSGRVGLPDPCGHIDFYPNGGGIQPQCHYSKKLPDVVTGAMSEDALSAVKSWGICQHDAALRYFLRSFNDSQSCEYRSYPCFNMRGPDSDPDQVCQSWSWKGPAKPSHMSARMGFDAIRFMTTAFPLQLLFTKSDSSLCDTYTPCEEGRCSRSRKYQFLWPPCLKDQSC